MSDQLRGWLRTVVPAALRKIEPHLPPWAIRLLLGSNTPLTYEPPGVDEPDPGRHRAA
ncbi:hypothetical protein AB0I53_43785 [Saccharopolyspora sp. NPDC050389]|uniref:hypothetical protein n=1 Tax=Saccharopolyspora sp. NPDC050389 TaxID=3155516 RepID=UPI0033FF3860